ncbi:MAG: aminoglycoside phosphotransferase family protein [Ruminococcaceae bacterium]|nr:aminoglycoside phosphotransferase family protein [Oscillospiraceae bacterium]
MQPTQDMFRTLTEIANAFGIPGEAHSYKCLKGGNINDTYDLEMRENGKTKSYIVQRINANVFKNPDEVMENFDSVTRHIYNKLRRRGEKDLRKTLKVYHRSDGSSLYTDNDGNYWRVISCVYDATSLDEPTLKTIKNAGLGFALFQKELDDYPIDTLHETIPDFHNTPKRLADFWLAVEKDEAGRKSSVIKEIEWVKSKEKYSSFFYDLFSKGKIKLRVTHNDTKCNNIMIDLKTGEPLAVIDLDTVMPGFAAYDFGDAIRSAAATAPEDEVNLDNMRMDFGMFEAFSEGYIPPLQNILTEDELKTLPYGAIVMTYELAVRFLTDYLNGDTYFKTYRDYHNLDRTRAQIKLFESIESQLDNMLQTVERIINE